MTVTAQRPVGAAAQQDTPAASSSQRPLGVMLIIIALLLFVAGLVSDIGAGLVGRGGGIAAMMMVIAIIAGLVYAVSRPAKA